MRSRRRSFGPPGRAGFAALALLLFAVAGVTPVRAATPSNSKSSANRESAAREAAEREAARRRVPRPVHADTAWVSLAVHEGRAFVAYPPGAAPAPGIVVLHERWGLNGPIREVARRLARQGYVAIVPDLFGGRVTENEEEAQRFLRELEEPEALELVASARDWLAAEPRTSKRRRGVLGFGIGGRLALGAALASRGWSAAVLFGGVPESRAERLDPLDCPLLAHFGAGDTAVPPARVEAFERTLEGLGKTADVFEYPGAGPGFVNEGQPDYRPEAARLAWVRTLDFLQKYVKDRP